MTKYRGAVLAAVTMIAAAQPADAAWLEARSKHFIVYANASEKTVTDFSARLELLDAELRMIHKIGDREGIESDPVTIFVAPDVETVRKLYGTGASKGSFGVDGFYEPRVSGSVAFTPRHVGEGGQFDMSADIVLFHEYAHHFLLGNFPEAYPQWFSEGYAEFVSTTKFTKDSVQVGGAAAHRAYGLILGKPIPLETLFTSDTAHLSGEALEAVYGRGWLLTHYVLFNAKRQPQFQEYLTLLNAGTPSLDAARKAFGDLKQLNKELDATLTASRISVLNTSLDKLPKPKITVRPLSAGESAMMMARMQSQRGTNPTSAAPIYQNGARIAAAYPQDAIVQGWLAEMAFDAGDNAAAEAAADRALAVDPKSVQALIYKARVHFRRAAKDGDAKAWSEARSWIIKANHVDPNNAQALALYYRSFREAHAEPTTAAVAGLQRAFELVPQDQSLRFTVARQDIVSGDIDGARRVLRPLAYDPHGSADRPVAHLLADLDSGKKGEAALADFDAAVRAANEKK